MRPWLKKLWGSRAGRPQAAQSVRRHGPPLAVEQLEDRAVPAVSRPSLPSLTCTDVSAREDVPNFDFNVQLSGSTAQTVMVSFATRDGTATAKSDYTTTSGTLIFAPGEVTKTITVPIKNDGKAENDEMFYVILSDAANAIIERNGTGIIYNDDGKLYFSGSGALQAAASQTIALASTLLAPPEATEISLSAVAPTWPGLATLAGTPVPIRLPAVSNTAAVDWIFRTLTDEAPTNPYLPRTCTGWDVSEDGWLDPLWTVGRFFDSGLTPGGSLA